MNHPLIHGLLAMLIAACNICPFDAPDPDDEPLVIMPGLGPL
jgi:hypothetical protein